MTKADMIKALADKTGMTKADSQRASKSIRWCF